MLLCWMFDHKHHGPARSAYTQLSPEFRGQPLCHWIDCASSYSFLHQFTELLCWHFLLNSFSNLFTLSVCSNIFSTLFINCHNIVNIFVFNYLTDKSNVYALSETHFHDWFAIFSQAPEASNISSAFSPILTSVNLVYCYSVYKSYLHRTLFTSILILISLF